MFRFSLLFAFVFLSLLSNSQSLEQRYAVWLEETPFNGLLFVKHQDAQTHTLFLQTDSALSSPDEIRQLYATLDSLYRAQKEVGIDIARQLLLKYTEESQLPAEKLKVRIESKIPILFSVSIYVESGQLVSNVEYVDDKGSKVKTYLLGNDLFNPREFFIIDNPAIKVKKSFEKWIASYIKTNYPSADFVRKELGELYIEYTIHSKSMITPKYHEKIVLKVMWIPVDSKQTTEMNYELQGYYASGILSPGEYRDIKEEYFAALMVFNENLKEQIHAQFIHY